MTAENKPADMPAEIEALRKLAMPELVARYVELFGKPPRVKHKEFIWKRCAWKLQELQMGGLSNAAKSRLEELISRIKLPMPENQRTVSGKLKAPHKPGSLKIGAVITREWHGAVYSVRVVDGGFEYSGTVYKSLSAVATAITNQHWNGPLFFGFKKRGK